MRRRKRLGWPRLLQTKEKPLPRPRNPPRRPLESAPPAAEEATAPAAAEEAPAAEESAPPATGKAPAPSRGKTVTDAEVMSWVKQELASNPNVSVDELLEGAIGINAGIAELTKRQFHARYPLQVKRAARRAADAAAGIKPRRRRRTPAARPAAAADEAPAAADPTPRPPGPAAEPPAPAEEAPAAAPAAEAEGAAGVDRAAARKAFFDFAADITAAEDTTGVVKVLAAMDDYIDRIA